MKSKEFFDNLSHSIKYRNRRFFFIFMFFIFYTVIASIAIYFSITDKGYEISNLFINLYAFSILVGSLTFFSVEKKLRLEHIKSDKQIKTKLKELPLSDFKQKIDKDKIEKIFIIEESKKILILDKTRKIYFIKKDYIEKINKTQSTKISKVEKKKFSIGQRELLKYLLIGE